MLARTLVRLAPLLLAWGCATPCTTPPPLEAPFALPGGGEYLVFEDLTHGTSADRAAGAVPSGAGRALASTFDPVLGVGLVVYEGQLAFVNLFSGEVDFADHDPLAGPVQVAAVDGLATILAAGQVELIDLETRQVRWRSDAAAWAAEQGLGCLDAVAPIDERRFCLVGSNGVSAFSGDAEAWVWEVDTSRGGWQIARQTRIAGLMFVHAVSVDAGALFVAGVLERSQGGAGTSTGRLWQDLVVVRIGLDGLAMAEVVHEQRQDRTNRVRQVEAKRDMLAVLTDRGELSVFRLQAELAVAAPYVNQWIPTARSIAWVDDEHLVVARTDGEQTIEILR